MSRKHRIISEYEFKDDQSKEFVKFKTLEKKSSKNARIFVKNIPAQNVPSPIILGNILDKPDDVNWKEKFSHYETIHPNSQRDEYNMAFSSGSFCVSSGTFNVLKGENTQVIVFPLDPVNQDNPIKKCEFTGNMGSGTSFLGNVDAPTWVGYVTTSGTVKYETFN